LTLIWLLTLRVLFFLVSTKRNFFFQNKIGSGWKKCGCLVGTSKSSTKPKKNDVFVLCVKTQRRSCRLFGIFWKVSPLLTGLSSKYHNFFSIWSLLSLEKYVWQKYSLCLFSKRILSLSVSHHFYSPFPKKMSAFCQKLRVLAGNRQTTKKILNEKFECFRCFFIRWLY
jgi:hypothetical protein